MRKTDREGLSARGEVRSAKVHRVAGPPLTCTACMDRRRSLSVVVIFLEQAGVSRGAAADPALCVLCYVRPTEGHATCVCVCTPERIQRPPSLQCRHSVRPRPARPMLTAPPCTRRRPACRMSTSRGSDIHFAARPALQPQHLHGAPIIMRVQHPAQGRRTEVSSMLQHVQ